MAETAEQLSVRRKTDRAVGKIAAKRRRDLESIGALVVRFDRDPSDTDAVKELRERLDRFNDHG
jgi:hypothetical protein